MFSSFARKRESTSCEQFFFTLQETSSVPDEGEARYRIPEGPACDSQRNCSGGQRGAPPREGAPQEARMECRRSAESASWQRARSMRDHRRSHRKGRRACRSERAYESLVLLRVHQRLQLPGIVHPHPDNPAISGGIGVDPLRLVHEGLVDLHHGAAYRRLDLARRLDRLDDRRLGPSGPFAAELRKLDEDELSKLVLGIVGDAHHADLVILHQDPLVVFGELHLAHGKLLGRGARQIPRQEPATAQGV